MANSDRLSKPLSQPASGSQQKPNMKKIANIVESINDYFYAIDKNWNINYANKRVADDFGLKIDELIGKNFWNMFPRFLGTEVERNFCAAMAHKEIRRFEWKALYSKGFREFTVFPSHEGITVYGKDITDRKKTEEALRQNEELFAKAFYSSPVALFILGFQTAVY